MPQPNNIHLALFLSRATPLNRWYELGIYPREIALYRRLAKQLGKLSIVTAGGEEDCRFQGDLGNIEILYNRWNLSPNMYSLLAPILHQKALKKASIFKTNQLDGGWTAAIAGRILRKPTILRAGYIWADSFSQEGSAKIKQLLIKSVEKLTIQQAASWMFTTQEMKNKMVRRYSLREDCVYVVPNYVDTEVFSPQPHLRKPKHICFVGRVAPIKNINLIIEALSTIPETYLQIIGAGEQHAELEELARKLKVNAYFMGSISNDELPQHINQAEMFVLPSKIEGHPKALIEAMSCGTAVIGTNVEGIRNVIQHRKTGILCGPSAESLRASIQELLSQPELRESLGKNARKFVLENYSLDKVVDREIQIYQTVIQDYVS